MRFADDAKVNVTCRELSLQCLLPLSQMKILMRYLYYETLLLSACGRRMRARRRNGARRPCSR